MILWGTIVAMYLCYLFIDNSISNLQERLRHKDRRLQKGLFLFAYGLTMINHFKASIRSRQQAI